MKKIAIVQSNYIPWKGYFDLIAAVDEFVIYDDMQFTRRDWRNRNRIKTPQGVMWLTVPVKVKGKYFQRIRETEIDSVSWANNHWKSLRSFYGRAPYFKEVSALLESVYCQQHYTYLSELNRELVARICQYLGIHTQITSSRDYLLQGDPTERLLGICSQARASSYLSGPAAREYMRENLFAENNVALEYFDYSGYPVYPQMWGAFVHEVSILDMLFNCGSSAKNYMKCVCA